MARRASNKFRKKCEHCIDLLNEELTKPFSNGEDLSLNLMYIYVYAKKSGNTDRIMVGTKPLNIIIKYGQ